MNYNVLLSIGCNHNHTNQIHHAKECLSEMFPGITFSDAILNPAIGQPTDAPPYSNMLARFTTTVSEYDLKHDLKKAEAHLGDTPQLRSQGIIMMDLDILQYDNTKRHLPDWDRNYIKELLRIFPVIICLLFSITTAAQPSKESDSNLLGIAVEYFQGGKYHEAIITFEKLKRHYTLNPRFSAYLGMSYYKEQKYEEAVENLSTAIPELTAFSPKEQAVYIFCCAESLFELGRYEEALRYYEMILPLVEGNDKGDVLFHTAFSHYLLNGNEAITPESAQTVIELLTQASILYEENANTATELQIARLKQTKNMLRGLKLAK